MLAYWEYFIRNKFGILYLDDLVLLWPDVIIYINKFSKIGKEKNQNA